MSSISFFAGRAPCVCDILGGIMQSAKPMWHPQRQGMRSRRACLWVDAILVVTVTGGIALWMFWPFNSFSSPIHPLDMLSDWVTASYVYLVQLICLCVVAGVIMGLKGRLNRVEW
jgi:hypothetical protein